MAVDLSYLSVKEQETVSKLAGQGKKVTAGRSVKLSADVYEKYFADIKTGEYDVTVQSKNTGHYK